MLKQNFEMCVLVNGKSIKEYLHNGRTYIEGREKREFEIVIKNNTAKQILAVVSVDGCSIIDGELCDMNTSSGYVVSAFGNVKIPGWRLTNDEVAKFFFADRDHSYATAIADEANEAVNLGIIGCAIFSEQYQFIPHIEPQIYRNINNMPTVTYSTFSDSSVNSNETARCSTLGTGFGQQASNHVVTTEFERATTPLSVLTIYYDTKEGLKKRGVAFTPVIAINPNPFPGTKPIGCKPPRNWQPNKNDDSDHWNNRSDTVSY